MAVKTTKAVALPPIIGKAIVRIRGTNVILDSDLARIYGTSTKRLLEQFKRNRKKFPTDFAYLLTKKEVTNLRSQIATSSAHGGRRTTPIAFTEHGAIMAATVLNSEEAVAMSVFVVRAFVSMREVLAETRELSKSLEELEFILSQRLDGHEQMFEQIFKELQRLLDPPIRPSKKIGFNIPVKTGD